MSRVPARLKHVATVRFGFPFDATRFTESSGIPVIRIRDLESQSPATLTDEPAPDWARVTRGDVLVGMDGEFRAAVWDGPPSWLNQRVCAIDPKPGIDARFLAYAVQRPLIDVEAVKFSTTVKHLSAGDVLNLPLAAPSSEEQRQLADCLDAETVRIDDVIGYRTRLSSLISERSRAAIDDALRMAARLRLKVGLKVRPDYGAAESSIEGDLAWPRFIRITDIDDRGQLRRDEVRRLPPEIALPFMLDNGDILVARSGATVGKAFHFRSELHGEACFAGYLIRLRCDPGRLLPEYLALITQSGGWWRQVDEAIQQATIQNVSAARYADFVVPMPSVAAQRSVLARLTPLLVDHANVGAAIDRQIALLRERRQALITAAVSGSVDVGG